MAPPTYRQLQLDPKFADLSYEAQTSIRAEVLQNELGNDPKFQALSPLAKQKLIEELIFAPPTLKNKRLEALVGKVGEAAKRGDRTPIPEVSNAWGSAEVFNALNTRNFYQGSIVGSIYERILNKYQKKQPLEQRLGQPQQYLSLPERFPEDADRILAYYDYVADNNSKMRNWAKLSKTALPIVGTLMEAIPMYTMGAGTYRVPRGIGKLAMAPFTGSNGLMTKMLTSGGRALAHIGGEVAHGVATSAMWVARENVRKLVQDPEFIEDATFKSMLKSAGKEFTQAFLWDVIANLAVGVAMPMMKALGRNFKGWGNIDVFLREFDEEQYRLLLRNSVLGKQIDPELFARLPDVVKRRIDSGQAFSRVFSNVPKKQADDLFRAYAMANGWTATPEAVEDALSGRWRMEFNGGGIDRTLNNLGDAQKFLDSWMEETLGVVGAKSAVKPGIKDMILSGASYDNARTRAVLQGFLPEGAERNTEVLAKLWAPGGGRWTPGHVKGAAKASLRAIGADDQVVKAVRIAETKGSIKAFVGDEAVGNFAKEVKTAKQETEAIRSFMENVKKYAGEHYAVADNLLKDYSEQVVKQRLYSPEWVRHAVENKLNAKLLEPTGKGKRQWTIGFEDGTKQTFDSYDDIGNFVIAKTIEPEALYRHLRQYEGYRLKHRTDPVTDQESYHLFRGKKQVARYNSFEELLNDRPDLVPKISSDLGPELTFVDNNRVSVKYIKGSAIGPYQDVLRHLDNFRNYKVEHPYVQLEAGKKGSLRMNKFTKQVEVYLPDLEWRSPVENIKTAKKLLSEGVQDWDLLKEVAAQKGFRLEPMSGRYILYSDKGVAYSASTAAELSETLKTVPIPEWAPELSGLDDIGMMLEKFPKPPENMFQPKEFQMTPLKDTMTAHDIISGFYRPPDQWLVKAIEAGGDQQVLKYFREIEDVRQFLRGEEYKTGQAIYSAFVVKGKMLKKSRRIAVGEYLKAKGAGNKELVQLRRELTPEELNVADRLREIWGKTSEEGLFQKFGVRTDDFLEDYLPRIRKFYQANSWKPQHDGERHQFLKAVFDNHKPPHDLDAFFKHQRVTDVIKMSMEDDPLALMLKYNTIGHREAFLGPHWSQVDEYLKKAGGTMDKRLLQRFQLYRAQVMGLPEGMADEWVRDASVKLFQKMGLPIGVSTDVTRMMMSWGYLAGMGFRPWLPIRNSFQIWTTLAPRLGNDWVAGAIQKIAKDSQGVLFEPLRRSGLMTTHLPLYGSELFDNTSFIGKLTHKGLQWYKNSDDFTRAVAYHAARDRFMDAVERFNRMGPMGKEKGFLGRTMTQKQFMDMSGLDMMPRDLRGQAANLIRQGKWNAAADLFATNIVTETMFPYRAGMGPLAFKGLVGKLFGMFGTYPVYYIENIKRALKYGSTASKLGYVARFLGNTTALYYLFKEGLGINATNFIWWVPADFTGGPYYDMMNMVLDAMDFRSYAGRQARGEMISEIPKWMSGFQLRSMTKAWQSFREGDMYRGLLNLSSAPINPAWFGEELPQAPGVLFPSALLPSREP